jgi:superfamily II DNA or RNA helicase
MSKIWTNFKLQRLPQFKYDEFEFRDYQQYSSYLLLQNKSYFLALATGLGKTMIAIASYLYYKNRIPNTKLLIFTKKSAILQVQEEFDKFFNHDLNIVPIYDKMPKKGLKKYADVRKLTYQNFSINSSNNIDTLVSGYSLLIRDINIIYPMLYQLKRDGNHLFMIFDESMYFKNLTSDTFNAVNKLYRLSDRAVGMTATVTKGKYEDTYAMFKGLGRYVSPNKSKFMDEFCRVWQNPKNLKHFFINGYKNIPEFKRRVAQYSFSLTKAEADSSLPPFNIRKIYLPHSREQINLIKNIYLDELYVEGKRIIMDDEESKYGRRETLYIKRALQDERLVTKEDLKNFDKMSPKTQEIIRLLSEEYFGEKLIIYSDSRVYLELLKNTIKKNKDVQDCYKNILEIHGDISVSDRNDFRKLFERSDQHNLMLMTKAGIEALNLQAASTIIGVTLPHTGGDLLQLAGRISRMDTKHKNLEMIYLLIEKSQDTDEYLIINQQMIVIASLSGESEKGLIDYKILENRKGFSKQALENNSMEQLLLDGRKRRKTFYKLK